MPVKWRINNQGIRSDREVSLKHSKFRIATFGDSETFGWSVALGDTFQRRMEAIDGGVEVINFGTPGYNILNVVHHMEEKLPSLGADLVFYMFHKNDLDPPLTFSRGLAVSYLYLLYGMSKDRIKHAIWPEDQGGSMAPERLDTLVRHVNSMIALAEGIDAPLLIGLMDSRYMDALPTRVRRDCEPGADGSPCALPVGIFWVGAMDIDRIRNKRQRIDGHMPPVAHQEIADLLCWIVSGAREKSCTPPGWR